MHITRIDGSARAYSREEIRDLYLEYSPGSFWNWNEIFGGAREID